MFRGEDLMLRRSLWITATFMMLSGAAYAQDPKKLSDTVADKWVKGYNSNAPEGVTALFTDEAPFIGPPGVLKGHANVEKAIAARIRAGWTTETLKINEAHSVGTPCGASVSSNSRARESRPERRNLAISVWCW